MHNSNNLFRRLGLGLTGLGVAAVALGFTFTTSPETSLPVKWPAGSIPVRIMLGTTAQSDGLTFNESARVAAQTWNAVIGSTQIQTSVGTGSPGSDNNVSEMAFASTIYGRAFDSDVLAVTLGSRIGNQRIEADILFNSAVSWDSYRGSTQSKTDLQRVAIHELGHLLGLDHPDQAGQSRTAIMNSRVGSLDTIASDDAEGAQAIYGPPGVPANDAFANATVINLNGNRSVSVKGYNTNATEQTNEPNQGDNPGGRSVWWVWTAPSAGNVTLDTGKVTNGGRVNLVGGLSSYYDTTIGVYNGSALGGLTKVADNDDIDAGVVQVSRLTFSATAGTVYRICVDGYNGIDQGDTTGADNGGIVLNLVFDGDLGTAPAITAQPASATVTAGGSASFSVTASGTAPLSYQWLFGGTAISGATSSTYSISSTTTSQAGSYSVTVSNAAGSVTSNSATLTVNPAPVTPAPSTPSGGGGGGGGAPSTWFCVALAALGLARFFHRSRR